MLLCGPESLQDTSDVYSLGATFFNLLTRKTPWSHDEEVQAVWRDKERRHTRRDVIKQKVRQIAEIIYFCIMQSASNKND